MPDTTLDNNTLSLLREAFADYWWSEGCTCCQDTEEHNRAAARIAQILQVPVNADGDGYDWAKFRSGLIL